MDATRIIGQSGLVRSLPFPGRAADEARAENITRTGATSRDSAAARGQGADHFLLLGYGPINLGNNLNLPALPAILTRGGPPIARKNLADDMAGPLLAFNEVARDEVSGDDNADGAEQPQDGIAALHAYGRLSYGNAAAGFPNHGDSLFSLVS